MSQIRITDLPIGVALTGPEQVPAVQGGVTVSSTASDFKNFIIPAQGGNSGRLLGTDGLNLSWVIPPTSIPPQSGNAGRVLGTDGVNISWVIQFPSQAGNAGMVLGTNGTTTSWVSQTPAGVSNVALSAPAPFSVSGSPVTSSGTLSLAWAGGQTSNQFLATPSGVTGGVALRTITNADLPLINLSTGVSGNLPPSNLAGGSGANSSTFWRGDGTWAAAGSTGNIVSTTITNLAGMPVGQRAFIIKTGQTNRASTATIAADPDLGFTNVPIGIYLVEAMVFIFAGSTTNGGIQIGLQSSTTGIGITCGTTSRGVLNQVAQAEQSYDGGQGGVTRSAATVNGNYEGDWLRYAGTLDAASVGSFYVTWAQQTPNANATIVLRGSYISLTRLA